MNKAIAVLKKFAKKYNCALLADVRVKMGDKEHIFEHILLGSFGAVCVRTMTEMGEIYGNEDDVEFVVVDRKLNRTKTQNYLKKATLDREVLRKIISQNKIYNVKIDTLIVAGNKLCKPMISSASHTIVSFEQLMKLLCDRYDKEDKADAQAVILAIENAK